MQIKEPTSASGSMKTISTNLYMRYLFSSNHCFCLSKAPDRASLVNTSVPIKNVSMLAQQCQSPLVCNGAAIKGKGLKSNGPPLGITCLHTLFPAIISDPKWDHLMGNGLCSLQTESVPYGTGIPIAHYNS